MEMIFGLLCLVALGLWWYFCANRIYKAYEDGRIKDLILWAVVLLASIR
jgi:hypothetical protein